MDAGRRVEKGIHPPAARLELASEARWGGAQVRGVGWGGGESVIMKVADEHKTHRARDGQVLSSGDRLCKELT